MRFNEFLLERRKKIGKSQKDISEDISYSPQVISKWEKGLSTPNVDIVFLLCYSLEISLDDFFDFKVDAPIYKDIDPKTPVSLDGIKRLRREKNLTQKQLGDLVNVNEVQIMRYEKGESYPNVELFIAITHALALKPGELLLNKPISPQIEEIPSKKKLALVLGSVVGTLAIATAVVVPVILLNTSKDVVTVTLDANGGTFSNGKSKLYKTIKVGKNLPSFDLPTKDGNHITHWSIENETIDLTSYTVKENTTIQANWDLSTYTISINNDDSKGTVTGSGDYIYGTKATLSATHLPNYKFMGWYENDILIGQDKTYTFTVGSSDRTISTKWESTDYLVEVSTISPSAVGTVNAEVTGRYSYGEEISLVATVNDESYAFVGWYDSDTQLSDSKQWTYIVEDRDIHIDAVFSPKQFEYELDGDSTTLTSVGTYVNEKDITIPSYTPDGQKITSIATGTFDEAKETLESVYFPDGMILSTGLFDEFEHLKQVRLPSDLSTIPSTIFRNCTALESVDIPTTVQSIEAGAFSGTKSLDKVVIPSSVERIWGRAFIGCGCSSITFECDSVTLDMYAFTGCMNLKELNLPIVKVDGDYSICSCSGLERVTLSEGQTFVGSQWFNGCESLKSVTLPSTIKEIKGYAFSACNALEGIELPNGLETIGEMAFEACYGLESVFIPKSVTTIGKSPFDGCSATIYCEAESKLAGWDDDWNKTNCPVVWGATRDDIK